MQFEWLLSAKRTFAVDCRTSASDDCMILIQAALYVQAMKATQKMKVLSALLMLLVASVVNAEVPCDADPQAHDPSSCGTARYMSYMDSPSLQALRSLAFNVDCSRISGL